MENAEPRGQRREFTDDELRQDLQAGLKPAEIAKKRDVSRQAVYKRIKNLEVTTASAVVAPRESQRFVTSTIDAMEELGRCLHRVNKLQDACDEYLQHPEYPDRYDVSPRASEITVVYMVEIDAGEDSFGRPRTRKEKRRAKLSTLLSLVHEDPQGDPIIEKRESETKHADPRELILRTAAENRQTVTAAADLAKMLADARIMQAFREAMLAEIAKESPDCARRIAEAVRRKLILHNAFRGPDAVPGG